MREENTSRSRHRHLHSRNRFIIIAVLFVSVFGSASQLPALAAPPTPGITVVAPPPATFLRRLDAGAGAAIAPEIGQPVRIKIPAIFVDAAIENVGLTPDNAMDTPKDFSKVAWYQPGARPGQPGNAVMAGHVDSATSGRAVFWDLRRLVAGNEIIVVGDDGAERHFVVKGLEAYKYDESPLVRIFGPATGAHLNLITCDQNSSFDFTKREYAGNLVVYADLAA